MQDLKKERAGKWIAKDAGISIHLNDEDDSLPPPQPNMVSKDADQPRRKRIRDDSDDEDTGEAALNQVFKKAKLNEFDGLRKTGKNLEAWIKELEDFFALREFSEESKAKIAILQLGSVAKLWSKSYMQTRTWESAVAWQEFQTEAEERYCSPHYNMEKKMEFYSFKQQEVDKHDLSVDEYKERFLRLHKYAPEVTGDALKMKLIEGLCDQVKFQVKGASCLDFLDAVAKAENYERMEWFNQRRRVIPTGHRPYNPAATNPRNPPNPPNPAQQGNNQHQRRGPGNGNGNQNANSNQIGNGNQKRQPVRWQ